MCASPKMSRLQTTINTLTVTIVRVLMRFIRRPATAEAMIAPRTPGRSIHDAVLGVTPMAAMASAG